MNKKVVLVLLSFVCIHFHSQLIATSRLGITYWNGSPTDTTHTRSSGSDSSSRIGSYQGGEVTGVKDTEESGDLLAVQHFLTHPATRVQSECKQFNKGYVSLGLVRPSLSSTDVSCSLSH